MILINAPKEREQFDQIGKESIRMKHTMIKMDTSLETSFRLHMKQRLCLIGSRRSPNWQAYYPYTNHMREMYDRVRHKLLKLPKTLANGVPW